MPYKHGPNFKALKRAEQLFEKFYAEQDNLKNEIVSLRNRYHDDRLTLTNSCPRTTYHSGLTFGMESWIYERADFQSYRVFWYIGLKKHNIAEAVLNRPDQKSRTKKISATGAYHPRTKRVRLYTKANIRQAISRYQPWETDLAWAYEPELRKIRDVLIYQRYVAKSIANTPPYPKIVAASPFPLDIKLAHFEEQRRSMES